MEELLERLRRLLPDEEPDTALLTELLTLSGDAVLAYTGRTHMPGDLTGVQLRLAVIAYNKLGAEGERTRREGSLTITFDGLPREVEMLLRMRRVARVTA